MHESESTLIKFLSDAPGELSLDTETTGLTWSDEAFMVSYGWYDFDTAEAVAGYIDLRTHSELWDQLKGYIDVTHPNLIFHNAKFDMHKLHYYPSKFDDTCLMIYLLNEHHPKGLKDAASIILGETTDEAEAIKAARKQLKLKAADGYHLLPVDVVAPYAKKDAEFTLRLYSKLKNALEKIPTVAEVYNLEKQLILDVCAIELQGIAVDLDYISKEIISENDQVVKIEKRIAELVNKPVGIDKNEFNPRSPQQLLAIFASMGYTLEGTGIEHLRAVDHELAKLIVLMRSLNKVKGTYLIPMQDEEVNGVVHPNFNMTTTKTKRMSSSAASA